LVKKTKNTLFGKPRPTKNMGVTKSLGVWLWLFFKVFFILKYIKIIFFIFKKLFLISMHQNNLKI